MRKAPRVFSLPVYPSSSIRSSLLSSSFLFGIVALVAAAAAAAYYLREHLHQLILSSFLKTQSSARKKQSKVIRHNILDRALPFCFVLRHAKLLNVLLCYITLSFALFCSNLFYPALSHKTIRGDFRCCWPLQHSLCVISFVGTKTNIKVSVLKPFYLFMRGLWHKFTRKSPVFSTGLSLKILISSTEVRLLFYYHFSKTYSPSNWTRFNLSQCVCLIKSVILSIFRPIQRQAMRASESESGN